MSGRYELECPQCGHLFEAVLHAKSRSAACPVCGAALIVAVAVPVVPPPPPAPLPPPPPPLPLPSPSAARPVPPRAPFYYPPVPVVPPPPAPWTPPIEWPALLRALESARAAARIVFVILALAAGFNLLIVRAFTDAEDFASRSVNCCFALPMLIPLLLHVLYMFTCARLPPTHGGGCVGMSFIALFFSCLGVCGAFGNDSPRAFLIGSGAAVLCSVGLWLAFFIRLGTALADGELHAAAQTYLVKFGFAVLVIGVLVAGAVSGLPRIGLLRFLWEASFLALLLWLVRGYIGLLGTAVRAVERRAARGP